MPTKMPDADLEQWLLHTNRETIDAVEVQQRVPTEDLMAWLQAAWTEGRDPSTVQAELQDKGWQDSPDDFQQLDVDGDGREEWLVTVRLSPLALPGGRPGDFWVIGDRLHYRFFQPDDYFRFVQTTPYHLDQDFELTAPLVAALTDFTGDSVPEILLQRQMCGAHTCMHAYFILGYQDGELQSLISQATAFDSSGAAVIMPYPELQEFRDETGDGIADFVIHSGAIGSAGAGIQRTFTEVWAWTGEAIALADRRWDATTYRPHILYEANDTFAQGQGDRARALYQQAIDDASLQDEGWWHDALQVNASIRQFAAFRLALLDLMADREADATQWQNWLLQNYPDAPMTQAAQILLDTWADQGNLTAACTAVAQYLTPLDPAEDDFLNASGPTGPLRYMGYGNPSLEARDVCPIL